MEPQKGLEELREVLREGRELLGRLEETEENLQKVIIKGDARKLQEAEEYRARLQQQMQQLEEKRTGIVPAGFGIREYIQQHASPEQREDFLELLEAVSDKIYRLQAYQEVNRSLLRERLRFTREMREVLMPSGKTYDHSGQVQTPPEERPVNINKSC